MKETEVIGMLTSLFGAISAFYILSITNDMTLWMPYVAFVALFLVFLQSSEQTAKREGDT